VAGDRHITNTSPAFAAGSDILSTVTWNGNLEVDPAGTTGGALNFARTAGTTTVGAAAALTVDAGATVNVGVEKPVGGGASFVVAGALDPFTDSTAGPGVTTKSVAATVSGTLDYAARTESGGDVGLKDVRLSSLTVQNGGLVKLEPVTNLANRTVLRTGLVTFAGTGAVDLTKNEMIINDTEANVRSEIIANHITTSSGGGGVGSLAVAGGTEVRYTLLGDTNLDAKVDVTDLGNLASSYGAGSGALWVQGDTNYDGKVDVTDLGNLASNYGGDLGGGASSAPAAMVASSLASVAASGSSAVPEPTALGLLGIGAASLLGRRRRKM
jgi:hypothetical protein